MPDQITAQRVQNSAQYPTNAGQGRQKHRQGDVPSEGWEGAGHRHSLPSPSRSQSQLLKQEIIGSSSDIVGTQ